MKTNAGFHMGKDIQTAKDEAEASEGNEWTYSEDLMPDLSYPRQLGKDGKNIKELLSRALSSNAL